MPASRHSLRIVDSGVGLMSVEMQGAAAFQDRGAGNRCKIDFVAAAQDGALALLAGG